MGRLRSRLDRLEQQRPEQGNSVATFWHNFMAQCPEDLVPDGNDWSALFTQYQARPCPVALVLQLAERGEFITLEQANQRIAQGEIPPSD